jgi:hypothetical protein
MTDCGGHACSSCPAPVRRTPLARRTDLYPCAMIDWGGKVAAWLGAVAAGGAALAALFAQASRGPLHALFIALVAVAAVAFVGLLLTGPRALWVAWNGRRSPVRPAAAEMVSYPAVRTTGADEAAKELARIAKDQEHDRMRPVLEGRILPWQGRNDGRDHRLEIQVKTHWPLALIVLNVPENAWFTSSVHKPPVRMDFLIQFPEAGRTSAPFRPGHPASCPVRVATDAHGAVTAYAKCRNEYGLIWEDVEVTITLEDATPRTVPDFVQETDGRASGLSEDSLPSGSPIMLRSGPADGREVLHRNHPEDYIAVIDGVRHAWRHTDPQAWAPPDRTRPVYDYIGPAE